MKEIAVYGGTFDPPTRAHEAIMHACLAQPEIDELWVMPSGVRTDKVGMSSDEVRMGLLRQLITVEFASCPVELTDFEMKLPRPTETYRTVSALRQTYPNYRFWYVFGADSIGSMPTWEYGSQLREELHILAVPRAGYELPPESERLRYLDIGEIAMAGISSSAVRQAMACGQPTDHLVSPVVAKQLRLVQ